MLARDIEMFIEHCGSQIHHQKVQGLDDSGF